MQNECHIQHLCLQRCKLPIRSEHHQDVFRGGQFRVRTVNVHAFSLIIMIVCMISVYRQHGEYRNQLNTLPKNVFYRNIGNVTVVGSQCQYTSCHGIHDVMGWCLHDHIPDKICGKIPTVRQCLQKFRKLFFLRKSAKQKKKSCPFIPEALSAICVDQILYLISPVPQFTVTGYPFSVFFFHGNDLGDIG